MESYESHKPRCSIEEAYQVMEQSTYEIGKLLISVMKIHIKLISKTPQ